MMRLGSRIVLFLILALESISVLAEVELHVAPSGEKGNPGTELRPFASLQQARDKIRRLKKKGTEDTFTVTVHEGSYLINQSIRFQAVDGGSANAPVTYRSASGESARFFGGIKLEATQFKPLSDQAFIGRLVSPEAAAKIQVVDLLALGIRDYGELSRHAWGLTTKDRIPPVSLIIDSQRMSLARWPNITDDSPYMVYRHFLETDRPLKGYERTVQKIIDKVRFPGELTFTKVLDYGGRASSSPRSKGGSFQVAFDRMKYWQNIDDIFVDGVFGSTWEWSYNRLASVDVDKRSITLAHPELNGIGRGNSVRLPHFHFDNIPEELDSPGEYYIDREKGLLYLYPPEDFAHKPIVLVTLDEPMLSIQNTQHLVFDGLKFEAGRYLGVEIKNSANIMIKNTTVANFTGGGIDISGQNNWVLNSHIYGTGAFGVHLDGGDKKTLSPGNNVVANSHIHDFGWEVKSQQPGIFIDGVGNHATQNKIHDGTHFAIRIRDANDVIVERNEIYDLPKYHHFDGGALYIHSGRYPQARGVEIRHNYFHDIPTIGVYPDNFSWGVSIYGNIFQQVGVQTGRPAVYVNGGGANRTFNNLLIDCVEIYRQGRRPQDAYWMDHWNKVMDQFGDGKIENTAYAKYPDFRSWLEKKQPAEFYTPTSYVFDNVMYSATVSMLNQSKPDAVVDKSENLHSDSNWVTNEDPGFVDFDNGDYSLRPDSIIFQKMPDFNSIPFSEIGLQ
ncbi:MAG: right-handed parallel beta-helix repeat-containing protein [Pseudomonadales bacterium]